MSNSTTLLDTIATNQANKEVVANALFDAASPAMLWGRHASACSGLTWGYYGGTFAVGATLNAIANGTVMLTASTTNYLYASATTGTVSVNTTGFPAGSIPLYSIVTGAATVSSYTDERSYQPGAAPSGAGTVTDIAASGGVETASGSDITTTGTVRSNLIPTSYTGAMTIVTGFRGQAIVMNSATAVAQPLPTPGGTNFPSGWHCKLVNIGAGAMTLTTSGFGLDGVYGGSLVVPQFAGVIVFTDGSNWYSFRGTGGPYDVLMFFPGVPTNAQLMGRVIVPRAVTFPASLTGSYASATVAATGATTLTLARNGTTIGTVNFAAGAIAGTFTFSSAVTTAAGDVLTLTNQATADATLANISVSLVGAR